MKLKLARELTLPPDVVTQKINVLGQSGGGKTYLAMKVAELMLELPALIVAIDLVGVWPGLLSSADGLHPGFPVLVIGGEKGHLPLNPDAGRLTADVVYDRDVSVVLDASDLLAEDEEQLVVFLADFLEQLFLRHKRGKKRRHLFYEEAQEIFPETMSLKGHVRLRRIGTRLCKIGRNYGLGYTTITQEPQSTSKRILNQAGTLIAVRTIGELERKAIAGTARSAATEGLDLINVLPELQTGEAMVWSPAWLKFAGKVHVLPKVTFDSSKTPDGDDDTVEPKVLAPVEVEQLRAAMATAIAKVEAEDPAVLKRRVAELERQLAAVPPPAPAIEVPVSNERQRAALIEVEHQVLELNRALRDLVAAATGRAPLHVPAAVAPLAAPKVVQKAPRAPAPARPSNAPAQHAELGDGPQGLLRVLAAEGGPIAEARLAVFAGMSATGGGFRTNLKTLREQGLIDVSAASDGVMLSSAGVAQAEGLEPFDPGEPLAAWQTKLGPTMWGLVELLNALGPSTEEKLAHVSGMSATGGGFRKNVKKLRSAGLVIEAGDTVALSGPATSLLSFHGGVLQKPTRGEVVSRWMEKLTDGPRALFEVLIAEAPRPVAANDLAEVVGMAPTGGGFRKNLKKLRTMGIVAESNGAYVASPSLFP